MHYRLLVDGLARNFPPFKGIQIDYSWWGSVDVAPDMMPRPAQGEWAAPFRRFGQSMLYRWYYLRDEVI